MLFYDFEVFKRDWLVVIIDLHNQKKHVIINNFKKLTKFYNENKNRIWAGWNSKNYDQYILKGILLKFNPKHINDFIIKERRMGWEYSKLFFKVPLINYDVKNPLDHGLKFYEGVMGNNIKETTVDFDLNRNLTPREIERTVEYCTHDVEQTIEIFLKRKDEFEAHMGLIKLICNDRPLDLMLLSRTKPQLSAIILNSNYSDYDDEFDIDFPNTLKIEKYTEVLDWYKNPENHCYTKNGEKNQLKIHIAGVPHVFGFGGLHGAISKYKGEGYFINMDVASLYPSLMLKYNLMSRSLKNPKKYEEIYKTRLEYKKEKNPLQLPLKLVLNSTYGAMKDPNNSLYDPRQANRVCIYGQLLLLDLIEHLENHCDIIQSNTDGILIKLRKYNDYDLIDDICAEWEDRTGLNLEFEEFIKVYQKDVNNYVLVDMDKNYKSKGAYVKKLNDLDYDLPIVNKAIVNYMIHNVPIENTINDCDYLKDFQMVCKITSKYSHILHGDKKLDEKCIRIFASKDKSDKGVVKIHSETNNPAKISNSPENCFIFNENINNSHVPEKLDKQWYIDLAKKRLEDFGVSYVF